MTRYVLALAIVLATSACASDIDIRYPAPPSGSPQTGSVLIRLTDAMRSVSVSIDGVLVAEDEHTGRVHITDVPVGRREISVVAAAGGRTEAVDRTEALNVFAGQEVSMLVAVPPVSLGQWIWLSAYAIAVAAVALTRDGWWP